MKALRKKGRVMVKKKASGVPIQIPEQKLRNDRRRGSNQRKMGGTEREEKTKRNGSNKEEVMGKEVGRKV